MGGNGWFRGIAAMLIGLATLVGSTDAFAAVLLYEQRAVIRGPDAGACDGGVEGRASIRENDDDTITVNILFINGPPSETMQVFWVGTSGARGCHSLAIGFVSLGTITTNAAGAGSATFVLGASVFPGSYVHFDICPGPAAGPCTGTNHSARFGAIPQVPAAVDASQAAPEGASAGDPTR